MSDPTRVLQNTRRPPAEVRRWELGAIRSEAPPLETPASSSVEDTAPSQALLLLQEAEETLAQAQAQKAAIYQERVRALIEARDTGLKEGRAEAETESAALHAELRRLIAELPDAFERFCLMQAPALTQLCITAVEKILQEQLSLEPERVVAVVRSAIAHVPHSQRLIIQVHPEDLPLLQQASLTEGPRSQELILEADLRLQRGGCRIESRQGVVDASIEGALLRLSGILTEE